MKILEIIELRTTRGSSKDAEEFLSDWFQRTSNELDEISAVTNFRHLHLSNDFSIHIKTDAIHQPVDPSVLSQRLINALKGFGLVNYSVWVENSGKRDIS
jgi:hypothetical protein